MSVIYPILAILGETFGKVIDKFNFKKTRITPMQEIFLALIVMFLGILIITAFFDRKVPYFSYSLIILLGVMVIISFFQNVFESISLKQKDLSFREPFVIAEPIITSFLAFIVFPSEREIKYLVGIILGGIILYLGNHTKRQKLEFDKGTLFIILSICCSAILLNIYKLGLEQISPNLLFLFRIGGILVIMLIFRQIHIKSLSKKETGLGLLAGLLYLIGSLASLYSIDRLGLNLTIMLLLVGPALIYLLSFFVLKEEIKTRRIISSVSLLALVLGIIYI